jgi:ATP-dependent Clp protease adaptor protein ClpS
MAEVIVEKDVDVDIEINNPGKYRVLLINDDSTPMDFVVALLIGVFKHTEASATAVMLEVHNKGKGTAGIYSHEVAEQKGIESTLLARQHGWPLQIQVEPE